MRYTLQKLVMVLLFFSAGNLVAQNRTVSGKVTDADDGSALPGVNVTVKGTTNGTVTDIDGNYNLTLNGSGNTLVFSFIGLVSQEINVGERSVIDVAMQPDITQLSEVVVTGYGERSLSTYTGSASVLGTEKIQNIPMTTAEQALQGNVAGLQLSATSGTPGATQDIRIRGISSINASNDPLFVIDGVPVVSGSNERSTSTGTLGVLSSINQNDIESITVLKDAGATALYGARGANGVIVITTKSGKEGKPVINFSAQYGSVERAARGPKMLNAAQWEELYYEGLVNGGYAVDVEEAQANYPSGWDGVTDTNWNDVVTNSDALTQSYDVSMRGGTDKNSYYASVGYMQQDGVNLGSDYERISGRLSFTSKLSDKLSFTNSTTPSFVTQNGQLEGSAYFSNPDATYLFTWPIDPARNPDGSPNLNLGTGTYNPLYIAYNDINERKQVRILNSTQLSYQLVEGLTFSSTLGLDFLNTEELYFNNKNYGDGYDDDPSLAGSSYMYNNRNFNYNWKNRLDYTYRISDNHKLDFQLVYEAQKNNYKSIATGGVGFAADGLYYPSSVGSGDFYSGYVTDWGINSVMGSVNYSFKGNIFVDATLRREGNSRFAEGNRWGTFYSIGGSWVFSDEPFMSGIKWLNTTKLRGSYGRTGNAGIPINEYQATLSYTSAYNNEAGTFPEQLGNNDLTWEKQDSYNLGVDFGFINKITGTVEYFYRRTFDLLLDVPLSRTTGFESQRQNLGEMVNKGWEFSVNADILDIGGFKWNLGMNWTMFENEVTDLPVDGDGNEIGITSATRLVTVGQPAYAWSMRTWAGVDPATGNPLWYLNGKSGETTSVYAQAGRDFQGGNATPNKFGGINTRLEYKGIYATANMYFSYGNKAYDSWAFYTQSDGTFTYTVSSGYARLYDRWQKPGDISPNPKNVILNTSNSNSGSSRRLYDAGFMRLRNVTVGYNFPTSLISKLKMSSASVYVMGTNLWTKAKDPLMEYDPEIKADGFLDLNAPPLKTMVMGIRFGF